MNKTLGRNIVLFRKKFNMTQAELAEKMSVTYQTISNWERGVSFPDVESIGKLCEIFYVSADELFGLKTQQTIRNSSIVRKKKPSVAYYSEKAKSAKILTELTITMIVSFLLFWLLNNGLISGVFGVILYFISTPIFLLSLIGTVIFLFIAKIYSKNKVFLALYLVFLVGFIVFALVGINSYIKLLNANLVGNESIEILKDILSDNKTGNVLMIISSVCYYVSSVLMYFVFKDKSKEQLNFKFIIAYFALVIIDMLFVFVLKYTLDFLFVISLALLVYIKKDKTVEIPYYTDSEIIKDVENEKILKAKYAQELMPSSSSGIADKNRYIAEVEYDYQPYKIKISLSDIFSGYSLTAILFILIFLSLVLSLSGGLFTVGEIVVFLGIFPSLFYLFSFMFKKGGDIKVLNLSFLIAQIISLVIQNLIFMENLTYSFLGSSFMIIAVIIQLFSVSYFVVFYKTENENLWIKLSLVFINLILTGLLIIVALTNEDIKLGMLFIVLMLNMITTFIAGVKRENRLE